jgi:hypothetical protein
MWSESFCCQENICVPIIFWGTWVVLSDTNRSLFKWKKYEHFHHFRTKTWSIWLSAVAPYSCSSLRSRSKCLTVARVYSRVLWWCSSASRPWIHFLSSRVSSSQFWLPQLKFAQEPESCYRLCDKQSRTRPIKLCLCASFRPTLILDCLRYKKCLWFSDSTFLLSDVWTAAATALSTLRTPPLYLRDAQAATSVPILSGERMNLALTTSKPRKKMQLVGKRSIRVYPFSNQGTFWNLQNSRNVVPI